MTDFDIDIATPDGAMNTFIAHPDNGGPFPPIIMYMPSSGIRDELKEMARRLAGHGYLVALPNVFYRLARVVDIDANRLFDDDYAPVRTFMEALNANCTNARSATDTGALLAHLDAMPETRPDPVGAVGYCMGGRLAMSAIGTYPNRIRVMVSMYGGKLVTEAEDSPHLLAERVDGEMYFGIAENDAYVPMAMNDQLRDHLDNIGADYAMEVYAGCEHGFCFPKRYCYTPEADARHWRTMTDLFARHLGP